jgi:hypothetical protein
MKTRAIRKKIRTLCAVVLTACTLSVLRPVIGFAAYSYPNAAKYTAGDAVIKKTVNNLDVDWVSGQVKIAYHRDPTVELHETSKKKLSKDMQMRWWLDGDTLRVRFAKPGFHQINIPNKVLTITLPEDSVFGEVSMAATSADFLIPDLQTDSLKLNVSSGDIMAAAEARTARVGASSGDLDLRFGGKAKEIAVKTTSGDLELEAGTIDRLTAESSSGEMEIRAKTVGDFSASSSSGDVRAEIGTVKRAAVSTTSGKVDVDFDKFDALTVSATSGNVKADLPEKPGFTATLKVTSGDIRCDLPLTKNGKTSVCGSGSSEVSISTTSGDIEIR